MCEQGPYHHCECGCHEGRHGWRHEGCGCGGHTSEYGEHHGHHGGECGCHGHRGEGIRFARRFVSRAERLEELEAYLKDLQAEAKGAEERIAEMRAVGA
jgi:hypothetical protein